MPKLKTEADSEKPTRTMDSYEDANKQLTAYRREDFCENPACLGKEWHHWGCCSSSASEPSTLSESPGLTTTATDLELNDTDLFDPGRGLDEAIAELLRNEQDLKPDSVTEPAQAAHAAGRYALPMSDEAVARARVESVPNKTRQDTAYCVRLWQDWASNRKQVTNIELPPLSELDKQGLQHWLSRFIMVVRTKKGTEYTPNSLHHIVCGIMRYIRQHCAKPDIDFFKDAEFSEFRSSLDAEMKRLQSAGIGTVRKQAEPLSLEEEELLWEKGLLGDHSPQALLNTMVFMNGLYFALRSGGEHRQLRHNPCQIQLCEPLGERAFLKYTEDVSKNRPGGLKGRKLKPKVVTHYSNSENPQRCFVELFKRYNSLCPHGRPDNAFYLSPLKKLKKGCWFSHAPLGHNTLKNVVRDMCKEAGILGFKTNHSLRATTATRLYSSGVDEQLVMERTGHRSLEGIRSYKRTSSEQQENVSDILQGKKPRMDLVPATNSLCSNSRSPLMALLPPSHTDTLPSSQMVATSNVNAPHTSSSRNDNAGVFHLSSCSNVSINFHYSK